MVKCQYSRWRIHPNRITKLSFSSLVLRDDIQLEFIIDSVLYGEMFVSKTTGWGVSEGCHHIAWKHSFPCGLRVQDMCCEVLHHFHAAWNSYHVTFLCLGPSRKHLTAVNSNWMEKWRLWFQQQPRESFMEENHWLLQEWDFCLITHEGFLIAPDSSPRTILKQVSCEQASYIVNMKACMEQSVCHIWKMTWRGVTSEMCSHC
jgi:hypothetical protein